MPAHRVLISPAQGLPACCATAAEPDSRSTVDITNLRVRSLMSSPLACEMQKELVQSPTSACTGWSQPVDATLYLKEEMECGAGTEISSRVYGGREDGVMGPLEARRVAEGNRTGFWQAVIVDLFFGIPARRHSSCAAAPLKAGIDAVGARGDFQRHCGASIRTLDRQVACALTLDGEPGNEPQWRP